jgi:hypothetical protein
MLNTTKPVVAQYATALGVIALIKLHLAEDARPLADSTVRRMSTGQNRQAEPDGVPESSLLVRGKICVDFRVR